MVEVPTTEELEGLQKKIDELTAAEESRVQQAKQQAQAQVQQIQQQLQNVTGAAISTMGQIVQLESVLAEQKRERHQLEGMLQAMAAQQQR